MKRLLTAPVVLTFCGLLPAPAATTEDVLSKMDKASSLFNSMKSEITRVTYTKVLDEKTTESGTISVRKVGKDLQVYMEVEKPDPKIFAFRGRKAEIYLPRIKTVQEYDVGKQGSLVDQFLLIGFGTTGRDLKASYGVRYGGDETIVGQKAHKLQLTPIDEKLKERLESLTLWMDPSGEYPVQQQFVESSGNYYLFTYSNTKLNPGLTEESLKLKVPKGTKREVLK
ncbi:MAG: outer membrane lipoprotein carrier protein LolA [Bryobacteraceae bacterium]|nr:outer membrane lipoprotein carrier protein LolA [Bryobacteraceae bacterium]